MSSGNASPSLEGENPRKAVLDAERAQWLTVEEAAYVLRVGPNTVLQAVHRGQIQLFAVGKSWRIHVTALVQCQRSLQEQKLVTLKHVR